jgi:hypothetical protein
MGFVWYERDCTPLAPDFWWYAGHRHVGEDAALKELHDVEWCSDDAAVFTQYEDLRDGHARFWRCCGSRVVLVNRGKRSIFSLDLVRRL